MTNVPNAARSRKRVTVIALTVVVAGMVTLVAFSVPLYRLFCAATGYGGTTQRVAADDTAVAQREVTVQFDTSVAPGMPWRFEPVQRQVRVHLGEAMLVYFTAQNLSDHPIVGHATFNVTPYKVGPYFNKIQCFCFDEERLGAGETATMPVQFYVDPKLATDVDTSEVDTITLSYTFLQSAAPDNAKDLSRFKTSDAATVGVADASDGETVFHSRCSACHALDRNKTGPMLGGLVGRKAGSVAGYHYSDAVRQSGVVWSAENLDRWLADPKKMIPGSRMPIKVSDEQARAAVIKFLGSETGKPPADSTAAEDGHGSAEPAPKS